MINKYQGNYPYSKAIVSGWNSVATGVYYCGSLSNGALTALYIGKAVADGGIRNRLLQHLQSDNWPGVTHFGYRTCTTAQEAENLEASEIKRCQPRYNTQGK